MKSCDPGLLYGLYPLVLGDFSGINVDQFATVVIASRPSVAKIK